MTYVRGLVCRECGRSLPQSPVRVCEYCFGPLEVDYDYAAIRDVLTKDRIAAGPPSIWRYCDLLPLDDEPLVGRHVGWTPLVRARNLGEAWGLRALYLKNAAVCHPTWSFITGSGLKTVEALERRLAEPVRVGASLSAAEAVLPELQGATTR